MPTKEQSKADALRFLKDTITAVLATSFNDEPHAATVYYYVDDQFNFYFLTKRNTSKYFNAELNPRAAVVVGTGPDHITVQVSGTMKLIVDEAEKNGIVETFIERLSHNKVTVWPIEDIQKFKDRHIVAYKLVPKKLSYLNLDSKKYPDSINNEAIHIISG
jgi:nitroimidazol reductase NimA-like FMN-containing flavoprotein (pyridoxamine 5'-phosphate oxidase superfamily)